MTTTTPRDTPAVEPDHRSDRIQLDTLTGMRGLALLCVFSFHAAIAYAFSRDVSDVLVKHLIGPAEAGLAFFFILSGFVLVWVARPGEPKRRFWRRRAAKIFPNHLLTWVAGLGLMVGFGVFTSWWEVLPSLVLLQSWIPHPGVLEGTNGPSWSLAVEMFFYALFPLLFAWCRRLDARQVGRWLVGLTAAVIVVTAVVGLVVPSEPKLLDQPVSAYQFYVLIFFPLTRLFDFTIGMLIARLVIIGGWPRISNVWVWVTLLAGWVLSFTLPAPLGFVAPFVPGLILMIGNGATADLNGTTNLFSRRWFVWLGDISFAFYLVHGLVLIYSERAIGQGPYPAPWAAVFVLGVLTSSLAIAHVLRFRYEDPMMRRWSRPRARPAAATGSAAEPAAASHR